MGISESDPLTKEHTRAEPQLPLTYVEDVQLGLHVVPEQLKWRLSQKMSVEYFLLPELLEVVGYSHNYFHNYHVTIATEITISLSGCFL